MALIPEEKIAEVRDRTDIVEVVGEFVTLKRSGVNHKGLCPFHGEKTPSFNVNSAKQMFHCFGCGKSGDVIGFLMEVEGKPFIEVVRTLAKRASVELPDPNAHLTPAERDARRTKGAEHAKLVRVNQLAAEFFRAEYHSPRGARARAYVEHRQIAKAVVDGFLLGYAPPGWDGLVRFFAEKRVPSEMAERAGLVRARDNVRIDPAAPPSPKTHFDLFRDRVMCPILSPSGEVIAFSGRVLDGAATDAPKYINSPETPLYKKGEHLFGLHVAKAQMRKTGRAILVEGNFDVLAMHCHGFTETVAPLGTALTAEQARLLHRYAPKRVCMFLDGDAAGLRAAARNVGIFLDEDLTSVVALIPKGDDPDTFLKTHGKDALELLLSSAKESVEYFCDHVWTQSGASIVELVASFENDAAPIIRKVKNETARRRYAQQLALGFNLPLDQVERVLRAGGRVAERAAATEKRREPVVTSVALDDGDGEQPAAAVEKGPPPKLEATDVELIALLADHPRLVMRLAPLGALRAVASDELREVLTTLARSPESGTMDPRALADKVGPWLRPQVVEAAMSGRYASVADPERALKAIVQKADTKKMLAELQSTLAAARAAGDVAQVQQLGARINELKHRILGIPPQA